MYRVSRYQACENFSLSQIKHLVDTAADSLRVALDTVAPLERRVVTRRKFAPWYNPQTRNIKQTVQKPKCVSCSTDIEESRLVCQDSLKAYKKALHNARAAYNSEKGLSSLL